MNKTLSFYLTGMYGSSTGCSLICRFDLIIFFLFCVVNSLSNSGDATQYCGGDLRNSVYQIQCKKID